MQTLLICALLLHSGWVQVPRAKPNQIRSYEICATQTECDRLIITNIQKAKKNILIQNYVFSHDKLGVAIFDAHFRGVTVEAIVASQEMGTLNFLLGNDIPTWIDTGHKKVVRIVVIDEIVVLRQIINAGVQSVEMDNNLTIASIYTAEFNKHKKHSMFVESDYE